MEQARSCLWNLAGVQSCSFEEFTGRRWHIGSETLSVFMATLQNLAAHLSLPEGIVKSQFINGLPIQVSNDLKVLEGESLSCAQLCAKAERLWQYKTQENITVVGGEVSPTLQRIEAELAALKLSVTQRPKTVTCYNCNKEGHWARNCTDAKVTKPGLLSKSIRCYKCGQLGHMQWQCTKN